MKSIKIKPVIILLATVFMIACTRNTQPDDSRFERLLNLPYPAMMDSLYNIQSELYRIYGNENFPDSVYHHLYDYYDDLIDFAERKGDKRLVAATTFMRALIDQRTFKNYKELADYCDKIGFQEIKIDATFRVACLYHLVGQVKECFLLCNAVEQMIDEISNERYPDKTSVYYQIGMYYYSSKEYRIALRYFQKSLEAPPLARYYTTLISAHNTCGLCYVHLDEYDNARACYQKILDSDFFRQYNRFPEWEVIVKANIADIQAIQGHYAEAIPVFKNAINYFGKHDILFSRGAALSLTEVFLKTGQIDSARCYMQQWLTREQITEKHLNSYFSLMSLYYEKTGNAALAIAYRDSLRLNEQREREYLATASILLKKQEEKAAEVIEKEKSLSQHRKNLFFALTGIALLLILVTVILINRRKIRRKNKTLVLQIKELQELQQIKENELLQKTTFQTPETDTTGLCPESRKDKLCLALRDLLLKDKVYRNASLSRDSLTERLGINRYDLEDAFKFCFNSPYSEYINELRLKDAVVMLEQSDLPIAEISEKVGFGTLRTFHRQFTAQYNMPPKDYRTLTRKE